MPEVLTSMPLAIFAAGSACADRATPASDRTMTGRKRAFMESLSRKVEERPMDVRPPPCIPLELNFFSCGRSGLLVPGAAPAFGRNLLAHEQAASARRVLGLALIQLARRTVLRIGVLRVLLGIDLGRVFLVAERQRLGFGLLDLRRGNLRKGLPGREHGAGGGHSKHEGAAVAVIHGKSLRVGVARITPQRPSADVDLSQAMRGNRALRSSRNIAAVGLLPRPLPERTARALT